MSYKFFLILFLIQGICFSQVKSEFEEIDSFARSTPKNIKTIDELVSYFSTKKFSSIEKARIIYVWLTDNISYDATGYNLNKIGDNSVENVMKTKKAVCAGYANLYTEIGKKMGLEIITVNGVCKGYEYESDVSDNLEESINHAWNLIRINDEWKVFDATWGSGAGHSNSKGKLEVIKKFNPEWFNVDPKFAIFSRIPQEVSKQHLLNPINFSTFLTMPYLTPSVFYTGWISPEQIMTKLKDKKKVDLPNYVDFVEDLKLKAPIERVLKKGKAYEFEIESKEIQNVYFIINNQELLFFNENGNKYQYTLNAKNVGSYTIAIIIGGKGFVLFEYVVE